MSSSTLAHEAPPSESSQKASPEPSSTHRRTVLPPKHSLDDQLVAFLSSQEPRPTTTLLGPNGEHLVLPSEVFEVLKMVIEAMNRGAAVTIAPQETLLTTQQAADFLGIRRSSLVSLVDSGEIDFERSERHRKIRLADVIDLGQQISARRRASLARMVEIAEQSGMYHKTASPKPTH